MGRDEPGAEGDCRTARAPPTRAQSHSTTRGAGSSGPQQFPMRHLSPESTCGGGEEAITQEQWQIGPESGLGDKTATDIQRGLSRRRATYNISPRSSQGAETGLEVDTPTA